MTSGIANKEESSKYFATLSLTPTEVSETYTCTVTYSDFVSKTLSGNIKVDTVGKEHPSYWFGFNTKVLAILDKNWGVLTTSHWRIISSLLLSILYTKLTHIIPTPGIYDAPDSETVLRNSAVTLTCIASSAQLAAITWSSGGNNIVSGVNTDSYNTLRY